MVAPTAMSGSLKIGVDSLLLFLIIVSWDRSRQLLGVIDHHLWLDLYCLSALNLCLVVVLGLKVHYLINYN